MANYVQDLDHFGEEPVNSKDVTSAHQLKSTITYTVNIPGHPIRVESELFRRTKKHLVEELDTPCFSCGSKLNRQVHHFFLEWSLANAVDWSKMRALHVDFPDWNKVNPLDPGTFECFVDHAYNMMVLCMDCHISTTQGIHCLPFPLWGFLKVKKDDFAFIVQDTPKDMGPETIRTFIQRVKDFVWRW